jgi:hypothetical protein
MSIAALFGKKKGGGGAPKPKQQTNQEEVRQKLDSQIDALNAKIDQQDKLSNKYQSEAKAKLKAKDKKGAQQALVKKKRCVKQIKEWEGALGLLEQQKMMLENAGMMKNIFDTVKNTNQAIHEAQGNMKIEDFEAMKEDFEEMKDTANEISEFFQSQNEEELNDVDEDMAELEKELAEEDQVELPDANKEEPVVNKKEEVKDENELNDFLEN